MSALGHKRTFAVQNGMSALPPKADMCSATRYVRFVPIADITFCAISKEEAAGQSGFFRSPDHVWSVLPELGRDSIESAIEG